MKRSFLSKIGKALGGKVGLNFDPSREVLIEADTLCHRIRITSSTLPHVDIILLYISSLDLY